MSRLYPRTSLIVITCLVATLLSRVLSAQAAIDFPKEWRGKTTPELLLIPEIARMPFVAQDQIVGSLIPNHRELSWDQRQLPLLGAEGQRAAAENRKPKGVLVWANGNPICTDYYTDGEHYYAFLLPPLFLSVKVVEY